MIPVYDPGATVIGSSESRVCSDLLRFQLACDPAAPSTVRRALLDRAELGWILGDVLLVTSELVNNAVMHSGAAVDGFVCVAVQFGAGSVSVSVSDPGLSGGSAEVMPEGGSDGGFGLRIVDQLSSSWGSERQPSGRYRVWAELPLHK